MMCLVTTLALFFTAGCSCESTPIQLAESHVESWKSMGMYLPKNQISFFSENFSETAPVLSDALYHSNPDVRQRAAYVIGELGQVGSPLEDSVAKAVRSECSRLVRLYLYDAIAAMARVDRSTVKLLRHKLMALPKTDIDTEDESRYGAIDERISLASALYVVDCEKESRAKYLAEVTRWLKPPDPELSDAELKEYWKHRWVAVTNMVKMKKARKAIPLLKAMLTELRRKPWVSVHVPRALKVLRHEEHSSQGDALRADQVNAERK